MVYTIQGEGRSNTESVSGLSWYMSANESGNGTFQLQYDGPDETDVLVSNGLGSIDLTASGGLAFCLGATSQCGTVRA